MARPKKVNDNAEILSYALMHLEKESEAILAKIAHIRKQIGGGPVTTSETPVKTTRKYTKRAVAAAEPVAGKTKRVLSEAARKRISLAQKKRWAASRKAA